MSEKQVTIFGTIEPVAPHANDVVDLSDGTSCARSEAFADCKGGYHRTEYDRHDADVLVVTEVLNYRAKWSEEYCTENDDYASCYDCIVSEGSHRWDESVGEWVLDNWDELTGGVALDECIQGEITAIICDRLDVSDCECKYNHSDYSGYSGPGCCLGGFKIEEHEDQVDVNDCDELRVLHEEGRLDDVLDDVNCDAYVSRSHRREKNETTGHYENVGRETYMPYDHHREHPTFCIYISISGGWDFVVPQGRMEELFCEAMIDWAGYDD
jgi:hypothetical protein